MKTENSSILILLAGGKSERMGTPKGLLSYKDSYWILEQIKNYKIIENATVFIGLGYDYQRYFTAISWFEKAIQNEQVYNGVNVRVVINNQPENGLFSTLQSVLAIIDKTKNVFILPIDVPLLKKTELLKMMEIQNKIVIPTYKRKNGHPVKLHPAFWKPLLELDSTDKNARLDIQIRNSEKQACTFIHVDDDTVLKNLNTPEDWENYCSNKNK